MNLAKLSANGQITVPAEWRRRLHLVPGEKVQFVEKPNGEVVVAKAGLAALAQAQVAFAGAAADSVEARGDRTVPLPGPKDQSIPDTAAGA